MKLNRAAFPGLGLERLEALDVLEKLEELDGLEGKSTGVAILSGSLPPCCSKSFYAEAVARLKSLRWTVVLDASGEPMRLALDAKPDLIKPNAEECEALVGFVPKTADGFAKATSLLREKAAHVVISDGGAGAWFDGEFVAAPKVEVVDTTAAGDTLLAEYCWRIFGEEGFSRVEHVERVERGAAGKDAAQWAVAAGSAACTMPGGAPPPVELVAANCAIIDATMWRPQKKGKGKTS